MYYIIIDCGTTNSRAYVVDAVGTVLGLAKKTVGVKDTSVTGSRDTLRSGLREIIARAIELAGLQPSQIAAVLSSGMITSVLGLHEIPHADAPCGADELAASITRVDDTGLLDGVPVYFVRGIRNPIPQNGERATRTVGVLDFMRGEETQIVGMMQCADFQLPAMVVGLSSHTKFMPIGADGKILGSLSTLSGQLFDAVVNGTFLHKSVVRGDHVEARPEDYFDEKIVDDAMNWNRELGLARTLMFPRFLDVLLDTKWYERELFLDALVAAEDMLAVNQLKLFTQTPLTNYYLIGNSVRCRLYDYIIRKMMPGTTVTCISNSKTIDRFSIDGMLHIARKAGLVQ